MSGLRKAKKYDWKDSNLALFGSDVEKNIKKASADTEAAWKGSGLQVGLQIWRIETYKPDPANDALAWDVHFWIGEYSTQDEYGTAAYKTVELDTYLNDGPVQHREVQSHESSLFKSYFDKIVYMKGGCDSGFRHVEPNKYEPRFFIVKKEGRRVEVKEIPMRLKFLNSGDVFIMDLGLQIYQWNGSSCSKDEKFHAAAYVQQLEGERGGSKTDVLEEAGTPKTHEFYEKLKIDVGDFDDDVDQKSAAPATKRLFKLSDASGKMSFDLVSEGRINKDQLDSNDAFIVDSGTDVIVWIGKNASQAEKKFGLQYAHDFLLTAADRALDPVTVVNEGQHCRALIDACA